MKNKIVAFATLATVGGAVYGIGNIASSKHSKGVNQGPAAIEHESSTPIGKSAARDDKSQLESEVRTIERNSRSNESFEHEFRSEPEDVLRAEVKKTDATLEPMINAGNKRALTIEERLTMTNGLRKRQALLKILIDRQIEAAKDRVRL